MDKSLAGNSHRAAESQTRLRTHACRVVVKDHVLDDTALHEEYLLPSMVLGPGGRKNSELGRRKPSRSGKSKQRRQSRGFWEKIPSWDENLILQTAFLPQMRSYTKLQYVKWQNYSNWKDAVGAREQQGSLNTCGGPKLPQRSLKKISKIL